MNIKFEKSHVAYPKTEEAMICATVDDYPVKSVNIGVSYPDPNYKISRENHALFTFEYVIEGKGEMVLNGEKIAINKGDTYVILKGESLTYRSIPSAPMKKYWINFDCDYASQMLKAHGVTTGVYKVDTLSLFEDLITASKSDKPFNELYYDIESSVNAIILKVGLSVKLEQNSEAQTVKEMLLSSVFKRVTLKEIADKVNMSESNLIRVFKKRFNLTPYEFLLNAKIDGAKLLLSTTNMQIKEIADKVCITDEHYFSTVFLRKTGLRPTAYRNQFKKE